jgi:hypothetical protein
MTESLGEYSGKGLSSYFIQHVYHLIPGCGTKAEFTFHICCVRFLIVVKQLMLFLICALNSYSSIAIPVRLPSSIPINMISATCENLSKSILFSAIFIIFWRALRHRCIIEPLFVSQSKYFLLEILCSVCVIAILLHGKCRCLNLLRGSLLLVPSIELLWFLEIRSIMSLIIVWRASV